LLTTSTAPEAAWKAEYQGEGHTALLDFISRAVARISSMFVRYAVLVQSSGTGKSRLVDEVSKTVFTIPLVLRREDAEGTSSARLPNDFTSVAHQPLGFPPTDVDVRRFLVENSRQVDEHALLRRQCAFLKALFEETAAVLGDLDGRAKQYGLDLSASSASLASKFRSIMSHNMTNRGHGAFRVNFYRKVVENARDVDSASGECTRRAHIAPLNWM
jgi:hypothetical protein